ncbi:Rv3235 family protein [Nocardioides sp. YIM 152315]|uniref:Rv3235 family protein n=1 Tax=Nocardioides sp. YIM 152315 TaxID=3031760 RepID=UPI0023DC19CD|nr:Rv3235 family protein [Nocardioides sp. YIM 152315]MDF1603647.1 Rv3235 family protein [Nocardioides sp. YIM 152315]
MTHQPAPGVFPFRPTGPAVPVASVQGTLALDLEPRREPPLARVIPIEGTARNGVEGWARRYAQAAVEIVGGDRPATQLLRWSSREVYEDLQRRAVLVARAGRHHPGSGRVQPVRPRVVSVRSCFLTRDTVEISMHVRYGERSRALAARFERVRDHWQCTALDFA